MSKYEQTERGIKVCSRWEIGENGLSGFECFLIDMGRKPTREHTIDRNESNKDYTPENCRWATKLEQTRNRRDNLYVIYKDKIVFVRDILNEADRARMHRHIKNENLTLQDAFDYILTNPPKRKRLSGIPKRKSDRIGLQQ